MKTLSFWDRIRGASYILWNGKLPTHLVDTNAWMLKINTVLGDQHTVMVEKAFNKVKNEPITYPDRLHLYTQGAGSEKRAQVLEYARGLLKAHGIHDISEWHLNFALEFLVGKDKGVL